MTRQFATPLILALAVAMFSMPAQAQFSRLLDSVKSQVEDKAAEAVEQMIDPAAAPAEQAQPGRALSVRQVSDFVPGTHVLVQHSFAGTALGAMPAGWRTDGAGEVIEVRQIPGRWLDLQANALFKLDPAVKLPERFTIEFDLLAIGDSIGDLYPVEFGFAHDNSVADNRAINTVSLRYYNGDEFVVSSRATDYHHASEFDLRGYANRVMPVAISVDGDRMRVYLDGTKISDARLFRGNPSRHFYLKAPMRMENGSRLALGNFRIAGFDDGAAKSD